MTDSGLPYLRGIVAHTPLQPTDFVDAHDHGDWDTPEQNPEPTEAYARELHRPTSSVTFDLSDTRALLILDQARTALVCLQDDDDIIGTMTIAAVPYVEGGTEYVITVRP